MSMASTPSAFSEASAACCMWAGEPSTCQDPSPGRMWPEIAAAIGRAQARWRRGAAVAVALSSAVDGGAGAA